MKREGIEILCGYPLNHLIEHAAAAVTAAATQAAAASRRFLNLVPNLDELMY